MTEQALPNWFDERIEPWLSGDLTGSEAALFEARLATDPLLEREVARATRLSSRLAELPSLKAPSSINRSVREMTGTGFSLPGLPGLPVWGWSVGGACAAALIAMVAPGPLSFTNESRPELVASAQPTAGELAKARADLALALGYVDQAGDMAARQLGTRAGAAAARSLFEPARRRAAEAPDTI